jgi:NadR type nicotinamide-nucleotide adenylyltransferase
MKRFGRGLVVGKFYPPHAGHHTLIDRALDACDQVVVCVLAASHESIPMELRAAWLRERHPTADVRMAVDDHPIDYDDPGVYDLHDEVIKALVPESIDVVVSAERYGAVMADRYGCAHLTLRREDLSSTAVRADPVAHWGLLEPAVRAYLSKRVSVVGAECTGTTSLSKALADHYDTVWVPEYGRQVCEERLTAGTFGTWTHLDFHEIGEHQQAAEDAAARTCGPVLICDTDALATCIWEERYLGESSARTEELAAERTYDLYVLTSDDIPFVQDGLRDGEHLRGWMTQRFRKRLDARSEPYVEVTGSPSERRAQAVAAVDQVLRWDFAPPLQPARP